MNFFFLVGISLCTILTSCGIPVIVTLNSPASEVPNQGTDYQNLTLNHSATTYAPSDNFLGYNVYYKIYPIDTASTLLISDSNLLTNTTPTVAYLTGSLGYHLLVTTNTPSNQTNDPITASPPPTINLAADNMVGSNVTITLSFFSLINSFNNGTIIPTWPAATISYNGNPSLRLFRAVNFPAGYPTANLPTQLNTTNLTSYYKDWYTIFDPLFWNPTSWMPDADMLSGADLSQHSITAFTGANGLEVDFFIAAYAWSPTTQAVYSVPVPWGVIHL